MTADRDRRPRDPYGRTPAAPSITQAERVRRRVAFREEIESPCDGPRPAPPEPQVRIRPTFN